MNKQVFQIIESIVKQNNGITIESVVNNSVITPNFSSGYFVSIKSFESKSAKFDFESFSAWLESNQFVRDLLPNHKKLFIGVWYSTNENVFYFDLNEYIADRESAIEFGIKQRQKYIWDIANQESIKV